MYDQGFSRFWLRVNCGVALNYCKQRCGAWRNTLFALYLPVSCNNCWCPFTLGYNAEMPFKTETHDATNRGDTSRRQVAPSALLLRQVACPYFVAAICRTNSNQFEFVRQIAATKFCRSDNNVNLSQEAICCRNLLQQPVAATCRSDLSHRVSRSLQKNACHTASTAVTVINALNLSCPWDELSMKCIEKEERKPKTMWSRNKDSMVEYEYPLV